MMTIHLKLQRNWKNKNPRIRFYIEKLQDPNIATHFKATIGGRFAALNFLEPDYNNLVNLIGTAMCDTAKEVLGKPKIKRQPWVPDNVVKLCDQRRELKKKRTTNEEVHRQYRELNKDIRKRMGKAKNDWINERCTEIETGMKANNTRQAYSILTVLTEKRSSRSSNIEDKNGTLLTEKKAVLGRWTEELYNYELNKDDILGTPGVNNVPAEHIKHGGEAMIDAFMITCQFGKPRLGQKIGQNSS